MSKYYADIRALLDSDPAALAFANGVHQAKALPPPASSRNAISPLKTYQAESLHGQTFERPPFVVDGFLPAGLAVLAGAPKRGKSWLALWLAACVSGGKDFLGMRTMPGSTLYCDLESRQYRVAERLNTLLGAKAPPALHITHEAMRLESGLVEQLDEWCGANQNPRLIILDTFARVKAPPKHAENAYEADYRQLEGLQRFALSKGISVLLVHHLRKQAASSGDPYERISGSMGLVGVADAVYLLDGKRGEQDATLDASGRDFENMSLAVRFEGGRWTCLGSDSEAYQQEKTYRESPITQGMQKLMESRTRWEGDASILLDEFYSMGIEFSTNMDAQKIGRELSSIERRLRDDGIEVQRTLRRNGKNVSRTIIIEKGLSQESFVL